MTPWPVQHGGGVKSDRAPADPPAAHHDINDLGPADISQEFRTPTGRRTTLPSLHDGRTDHIPQQPGQTESIPMKQMKSSSNRSFETSRYGRSDRHHGKIEPGERRPRRRRFSLMRNPRGRGPFIRPARTGKCCARPGSAGRRSCCGPKGFTALAPQKAATKPPSLSQTSAACNPTLTIVTLAIRQADYIGGAMQRGEI
jgi:hypothetical protein